MNLETGKEVTRARVTEIPLTGRIIKAVEELAKAEGFTELVFKSMSGVPIVDNDLPAGVGEDQEDQDSESESESNESESESDDEDDDDDEAEYVYEEKDREESSQTAADDEEQDEADSEGEEEQQGEGETTEPAQTTDEEMSEAPSDASTVRRSSRLATISRVDYRDTKSKKSANLQLVEAQHNLFWQVKRNPSYTTEIEYTGDTAMVWVRLISEIRDGVNMFGAAYIAKFCGGQQYLINKGIKVFGEAGATAATKELDQLHKRNCFEPILVKDLTPSERRKAQVALMFLTRKRDDSIKGRMVYNGKPTRGWIDREDAASPTVSQESLFILVAIDAKEGRDVMSGNVPNAFIQAPMPPRKEGEDRVIMKITGVLVDLMIQISPETYKGAVVYENGKKVIYTAVLMAIYGMLVASMLWYKKFRADLEKDGFVFNPYDPCVCNRLIKQLQQTVRFHVDDLKSSHKDPSVNDLFGEWLQKKYGQHGKVKLTRGKVHDYLGMIFDYTEKGVVHIDMTNYVTDLIEEFPMKVTKDMIAETPASDKLFEIGNDKKQLSQENKEAFHSCVAKGLYVCKRARPDICLAIAFLSTRVKGPNENDWNKLIRLVKYLNGTKSLKLTLSIDDLRVIKWYVDASFAVHADFKSHTGAVMTMGRGAMQVMSSKQKLNTRSSTEAELVGVDDPMTKILWTKLFHEAQGYPIDSNLLYQDNKSSILLEENGRQSAGKRSRAINVRYFFVTDQVALKNIMIRYCPTGRMVADYMTKPLQGKVFREYRDMILGIVPMASTETFNSSGDEPIAT